MICSVLSLWSAVRVCICDLQTPDLQTTDWVQVCLSVQCRGTLPEVFVEQPRLHQVCEQVPSSNHSSVDLWYLHPWWPLVYWNFKILFIRLNSYKLQRFPLIYTLLFILEISAQWNAAFKESLMGIFKWEVQMCKCAWPSIDLWSANLWKQKEAKIYKIA